MVYPCAGTGPPIAPKQRRMNDSLAAWVLELVMMETCVHLHRHRWTRRQRCSLLTTVLDVGASSEVDSFFKTRIGVPGTGCELARTRRRRREVTLRHLVKPTTNTAGGAEVDKEADRADVGARTLAMSMIKGGVPVRRHWTAHRAETTAHERQRGRLGPAGQTRT